MKTLKLLVLVTFLTSAIFSCKKDDDVEYSVVGVWEPIEEIATGTITFTTGGESTSADIDLKVVKFDNVTYEFKENPNVYEIKGEVTTEATVGNFPTQTETETLNEDGTWEKSGNKLTVKDGSRFVDFTIVESTDSVLRLTATVVEEEKDGDNTTTIKLNYNIVLNKK